MTQPLSPADWQRLRELRDHLELSVAEADELAKLLQRADEHEAASLAPYTRKLAAENEAGAAENQQLAALIKRQEALVATLKAARAERRAIDAELQRLLPEENAVALSGHSR